MIGTVLNTFFPRVCAGCGNSLQKSERVICVHCLHQLPLIEKQETAEELIKNHFYGRLLIEHATSLLYYQKKGLCQRIIHQLKYHKDERISKFLGEWLAGRIEKLSWPRHIDMIIPVPLHKKRKRKRGYNQVSGFGRALAASMNGTYAENILVKTFNSRTQVFKNRFSRTELKTAFFALKKPKAIHNRHLLLVDDIVTTGATLEACIRSLLKGKPAKISIATMAITV